jgi:hypothetical protein
MSSPRSFLEEGDMIDPITWREDSETCKKDLFQVRVE